MHNKKTKSTKQKILHVIKAKNSCYEIIDKRSEIKNENQWDIITGEAMQQNIRNIQYKPSLMKAKTIPKSQNEPLKPERANKQQN